MTFYQAYLTIAQSPSLQIREDYQEVVNSEFAVASDLYTIEEELTFGTQVFTNTDARVDHAINTTTGTKLGDDYRQLIFEDFTHAKGLGYRYRFNNNIWLCMNSDLYKYVTASTTVRRCNNVIKWYDTYGALQIEPCVIDYAYSGTSVDFDQTINTNDGNLVVTVQYNQYTSGIKINDRFIFGGTPFKVKSKNNFFQNQTGVDSTTPLLYLTVYVDPIASGDDLVNNIPAYANNYSITTNTNVINQSVGYTTQLSATVKLNNDIVNAPLTWTSSNPLIATVDNNGNVNLITNGSCVISVKMTDNPSVVANINVTVQAVPVNVTEVRISPNVTELLQSQEQLYTVYLYVNGVQQANVFTYATSGATSDKYTFTNVSGNSFKVKNLNQSSTNLIVTATSGANVGTQNIKLKGAF